MLLVMNTNLDFKTIHIMIFYVCLGVLPAYMSMRHLHALYPKGLEEGVGPLEI